ncbi:MAG: alkaline phosphatase family protein [Thermoanaerobaculia bacterium]
MKNRKAAVLLSVLAVLAAVPLEAADRPRLIVQITVDQLRGDLPLRYRDRFGEGGFRYFLDRGTWYSDAHHPHSDTETVVGHTTLATGAYPSRHGMVANKWYDRATNEPKPINNVEGPQYPLLSVAGETQTGPGASPVLILTTTFSDELAIATNGQAKVFSVSAKDRGAIPLAGHAGKAFWFSDTNGCFVSSTFYYSAYPPWVKSWCDKKLADAHRNGTWNLSRDRSTYLFRNVTNEYPAGSIAAQNMASLVGFRFGSTFPHTFKLTGSSFYGSLPISPIGDELTADFAKQVITSEQLGKHDVPDYLAISFSSTDLIAHWFSPASLESEDNLLRLDATLANLLSFIEKEVGLKNTIVVLSGDHGGVEYPEYLTTLGINTGRLTPNAIENAATTALKAHYPSVTGDLFIWSQPSFYLNQHVLAANKLDEAEVERVIANGVMTLPGVAMALTSSDMRNGVGNLDAALVAQVQRNYNPARSGGVYVAQQPQWQIMEPGGNDEGPSTLLQHGSPWTYDTYVPVAFAGMNIPAAKIARRVYTVDIAATLSTLLRTKIPSACAGVTLTEVVTQTTTAKPNH